jgi:hypothetical protein
MRRFSKRAIWAALGCLSLTACADVNHTYYDHIVTDHFARRDPVASYGGDAVANNMALQVRDPWPAVSANRNLAMNGSVAAGAIERYRTGKVIQPRGMGTSSAGYGQQQQSAQGGAPAGNP